MHKLHYTLKMIKGLMNDPEWHKQFREKGGLDHLYQVLCNIDMKAQITSSLHFSCMNLFCQILFELVQDNVENRAKLVQADNSALLTKIIDLMVLNLLSYETEIAKRGESYDSLRIKQTAHDQKVNKIWSN